MKEGSTKLKKGSHRQKKDLPKSIKVKRSWKAAKERLRKKRRRLTANSKRQKRNLMMQRTS